MTRPLERLSQYPAHAANPGPFLHSCYGRDLKDLQSVQYSTSCGRNGEAARTIDDIFGVRKPLKVAVVAYMPLDTIDPVQAAQLRTDSNGGTLFQYDAWARELRDYSVEDGQ